MIYRLWDKERKRYATDEEMDELRVTCDGKVKKLYICFMDEYSQWESTDDRYDVEWGLVSNGIAIYDKDIIEEVGKPAILNISNFCNPVPLTNFYRYRVEIGAVNFSGLAVVGNAHEEDKC